MKLSKKYKEKIKKRLLGCMSSMAICLVLIAGSKLAGLSAPISSLKNFSSLKSNADETTVGASSARPTKTSSTTVTDDGAIVCKSIVQGIRDIDLPDGKYKISVNGQTYDIELINYYNDMRYSLENGETERIVSLGDNSTDYKTLVVKYHGNLTIDEGVVLTANTVEGLTYKKGMYICVLGNINNSGKISMTARGTYNQEGEDIYLWKNTDNSYEYVPAVGGTGGEQAYVGGNTVSNGTAGTAGTNRATGGGGSGTASGGDASGGFTAYSGAGSTGTSYSGGSGGGGVDVNYYGGTWKATDAEPNGGAGGNGYGARYSSGWASRSGGGGAGNPGGIGGYNDLGNYPDYSGETGTGGLLVLYADTLNNQGIIESNGSKGGEGLRAPGGSSGGGSVNIFAKTLLAQGELNALGGEAVSNRGTSGAGGDGSVTVTDVSPDIIYSENIHVDINETYNIDKNKISLKLQMDPITIGDLTYESLDEKIAKVDNNGIITGVALGETKIKITDTTNNLSTYIDVLVIMKMESIVQGIRDKDLPDGKHTVSVNHQLYDIEVINYYDNMTYSLEEGETEKTISLGDDSTDYRTLIVKYHKNLTIDKGVTLTANTVDGLTYKKGMYLCVLGDTYNKGTISMTARGTYNQEGENVYLWKNTDNSYEYVPAVGGAGGTEVGGYSGGLYLNGNSGEEGINRATGGGGSGSIEIDDGHYLTGYSGAGSAGTSYSGGSGGGGFDANYYGGPLKATDAEPNGGAGGNGLGYRWSSGWTARCGGGGAGNLGGKAGSDGIGNISDYPGENGTGGLLILYTDNLYNTGEINSNGSKGGTGIRAPGGSSGGGSINIFANKISAYGTKAGLGGEAVECGLIGGAGGNGSETTIKLKPDLNYPEKVLVINIGEIYNLDKNKLEYIDQNEKQTGILSIGNIEYEIQDNQIATVDSTGRITALKQGQTKVKITDTTNNISTYIYLDVINNAKMDIQEGNNFTIALKQNGTVWAYGLNDKGQLGLGNQEGQITNNDLDTVGAHSVRPQQVKIDKNTVLDNIKEIATGYSHSLALTKDGEVYAWGANTYGQLGIGEETEFINRPQKIDILTNIVKIDAYRNKSIALSSDGKIYTWGEGDSNLPVRVILQEEIIDISGNLALTINGEVYNITDTTNKIEIPHKISKISCGETHNLALTTYGVAISFGENKFGECGTEKTGNIEPTEIIYGINDISAGNGTSILKTESGKAYVAGNNENGQLGLEDRIKIEDFAEINLNEEINIEVISAGEGTHSGLVDTNGFIWHAGKNTYGELNLEDKETKNTFTKTGDSEVNCKERIYLDLQEEFTISCSLDNTFNLKTDLVDNNQNNFEITASNNKIEINDKTIKGIEYGESIVTVKHIPTGKTKEVIVTVCRKMESIVQGFRDAELSDGEYTIIVNEQVYNIELINYYDNMTYSLQEGETEKTVSLGDNSTDYKTLVVKYHGDLNIDKGVTLTANTVDNLTYKKGMYICVLGNINNNGTISMTARGTYNQEGENVYLWKNTDNSYEYVPADGGSGGEGSYVRNYTYVNGDPGKEGVNRATGGGGAGGLKGGDASGGFNAYSGSGSAGTSYSGGSGGGATDVNYYGGTWKATDAEPNGGAGGNGVGARYSSSWQQRAGGGGAGNLGGMGQRNRADSIIDSGENGTGGLLILYADILSNSGTIEANGSKGGPGLSASGGSSGGGSINIFARLIPDVGRQTALGGESVRGYYGGAKGGAGGEGSVTINELGSVLNYPEKTIELKETKEYTIDKTKLSYIKLNEIQTEDLTLGNTIFKSLDENIATVDSSGKITAIKVGKTRVKITDTENGYSTYIIVNVTKIGTVTPKIKAGEEFVVALKENGTVWSWGSNENGQLGIGANTDTTENNDPTNVGAGPVSAQENAPVQVITTNGEKLSNIIDISAGKKSAIALDKNRKVYTWGLNICEQTGTDDVGETGDAGVGAIINRPQKVEGLERIEKVYCHNNNFYAIDQEGKAYTWSSITGVGAHSVRPTDLQKINANMKILDIANDVLLGEDGRIYFVEDPQTPIRFLNSVSEISAGEDHYLFKTVDGHVYTIGKGELGELGKENYVETPIPNLVRNEKGYLEDVVEISAGNKTSMAITGEGIAYVWGDNTNSKIGLTEEKSFCAKQIEKLQNKDGIELDLSKMEVIETGYNSSYIADIDGYVYSVGLNEKGQLGTEDNIQRSIFTKIGEIDIQTNPKDIKLVVNRTKEISIIISNTFNLKTDIAKNDKLDIINTNNKEVTIEEIEGVDNSEVSNITNAKANYRITGNKIGRVNIIAKNKEHSKNIWVDVVNEETANVPAKVENGEDFTVSLKSDGTVWTWGTNVNGQLGIGDIEGVYSTIPVKVEIPRNEIIKDISVGESHVLALTKDGKVYAWGTNTFGKLGLNASVGAIINRPQRVDTLENIVKVIANGSKSFAIDSNGKVYAWGEEYTKKPELLLDIQKNVIDIGRNYYLSDDGIVRKLSDNSPILLSLNEYDPAEEPVIVNERIVQISEGIDHLLLLGESGRIYSYGQNVYGALGDGTTNEREDNITTVVRVENGNILENIVEISAGDKYSIAVAKNGKVYTFGINGNGELGHNNELENGGIQESLYARPKEDLGEVERVTAGYTHTSIYKEDGNVYTWGEGEEGQLGNGSNIAYWEAQLVGKNIVETNTNEILIEEEKTFDVSAWVTYFNLFEDKQSTIEYEVLDESLALINTSTGKLTGIKAGRTTVIARERETNKIGVIALRILEKGTKPDNMNILIEPQVSTNGSHTTMLKVDGTVWCYGVGTYGELGNGKTENIDEPIQAIFPEGTIITKIATGENHSLALDSNGNVWAWGRNNYNQLGLGSAYSGQETNAYPQKITGLSNIKDIECGSYTSYAIGESGIVYSFGLNANGEGGIGSYTSKINVSRAQYVTDAIDIKAGKNHTMILKSTGEVYVTGSNLYGELAKDSTTRKVNRFTKVEDLENIVSIATGDSNNIVLKADGKVYSWGSNIYDELGLGTTVGTAISRPHQITDLTNIRYIDGGKGYTLAINNNNEVYEIGQNSSGELGNNTNTNVNTYTKLNTISDVMQASSGNGYTVMLKTDGTVWACGDYTHGNEEIKSKTKSLAPVQVGNDETGIEETEITIAKDGTKKIAENCAYEFNLIKLDKNFKDNLNFESLNQDIATVDNSGIITGMRVGTTRVKATSAENGKEYSILVKVVQNETQIAPKVEAGENFTAVLKADGSIWTFGYNADGRLAIGNSLTKDVPTKTNIISTYEDIKVGKGMIIALREDGTVWSAGNNNKGGLGNGTRTARNKLAQIQGLKDIEQIEAGEDFAIVKDKLGIIYVWGNNSKGQIGNINVGGNILKPTEINIGSNRIIDISAGKEQSVFVTAKGTVLGMGTQLNGTISGIENAIKAEVLKDRIIILTSKTEVYEYKDGTLTKVNINGVIDISSANGNIMYQTIDEKVYVSGENTYGELGLGITGAIGDPILVKSHGENIFGIGAGYNNTYIIENTGNIYSAGNNEYGSIGNGTRENVTEYTLVGDREFLVEPKSMIMEISDIEEINITGNPFNVFEDKTISNDEYNWTSDDETVVSVNNGKLTAKAEGTAHITITDKVTGQEETITRIVITPSADRIAEIKVNDIMADLSAESTKELIKYEVKVVTDENTGILKIKTNNTTDRISIDGGNNWSYNGILEEEVNLPNKITEFEITVGVQNNSGDYEIEYKYKLKVEKISDDIGIKKITVTEKDENGSTNTITAVPVSLTKYEVVVEEPTEISLVDVITNSECSYVSIDGLSYDLHEQTKNIVIGNDLRKEVKIIVKSEAGTEEEYTLVIYKKSEIMNFLNLKVEGKDASKISEAVYVATVGKDCKSAEVLAEVASSLASISIENENYEVKTSTKRIDINNNITEVSIRVKLNEDIKEYTLYIYREEEIEAKVKLDMLIVNGGLVTPEKDKLTYIVYLPSSETEATIRGIAKENTTLVKIAENEGELGDSEKVVSIPNNENRFIVNLEDTQGNKQDYTVIIRKADKDVSLDRVYVSKGDTDTEATLQEDGTYLVKVPGDYTQVDVTGVARYSKAKVQVNETGNYIIKQDTQNVVLTGEITQIKIKVQSEDGTNEQEYILNIQKESNNTDILSIEVDGDSNVTLGQDGNYHYILKNAVNKVDVKVTTVDEKASVKIDNSNYALHEITKQVNITAKQTEAIIRVKAEDGTIKDYTLIIEGLPDDTTLREVTVNGQKASYIEGKNRYEIRLQDSTFNIEAIATDNLASVQFVGEGLGATRRNRKRYNNNK